MAWLRRLHARLAPAAKRVLTRVALDRARVHPDRVRGRALILFKNVRDEAALGERFSLFESDRTPFAGLPDPISSVSDETLEDSVWRAVARLAAREGRVRDVARRAALEPGRGSRALYDLLGAHDPAGRRDASGGHRFRSAHHGGSRAGLARRRKGPDHGRLMTSQPNPKPRPGLAVVLVLVSLLACKDKMCEPKPLPEPWKPHAALIPDNTVICGNNRGPSDNYPPTQLFIYYKGRDTATAY
ncbi:MAG: hypothetical protein IT377_02225, partial [Polyangiaceae bacterium]|nr:hypothetical protein [Polyangiaceae bacterium]